MIGYGNRGMTFENLIEYANRRYRLEGTAMIEKQHTLCIPLRNNSGRIAGAKYEEKATVDFMGKIGDVPVAFEAKHTALDRIHLQRVEQHQSAFLRDWTKDGGTIGFVLISFGLSGVFLVPWDYWQAALDARTRKKSGGNGKETVCFSPMQTEWRTTGMASIRIKDFPQEWAVRIGGTAGLDYLTTVRRLWHI